MALSQPSGVPTATARDKECEPEGTTRSDAHGGVVDLPIESLHSGLSPREVVRDERHAAALAEVLPELPPIVVQASTMQIIDGVHRVMAAGMRGEKTIRACLFEGSAVEAAIHAVHANVVHGKPLTLAEREAAATSILSAKPEWADRRVASICGLSPMTVARLRARATRPSGQLRARVGLDGKSRPTDPAEVRRRIAEAIEQAPTASTRQIAQETGASQATVRDVRNRMQRGEGPLTSRLAHRHGRQRPRPQPQDDGRAGSGDRDDDFRSWLDARRLRGDADWHPVVDAVPLGHVYEVADQARQSADAWLHFAEALEDRARRRLKRSS